LLRTFDGIKAEINEDNPVCISEDKLDDSDNGKYDGAQLRVINGVAG